MNKPPSSSARGRFSWLYFKSPHARGLKGAFFIFLLFFFPLFALAQSLVTGTVTDAKTGEVLPFVNVYYSANDGTQTGINGTYKIPFRSRKLTFSYPGYKPQSLKLKAAGTQDVSLEPVEYTQLEEAVVTGKKQRYSRKDNPAVELMRKVIAAKKASDLKRYPYYSFDKYRRLTLALNDVTDRILEQGKFRKFPFLKDHVETCNETGKLILPISVDETVSQEIFRQTPRSLKTIVKGKRNTGLNEFFYTGDILTTVIEDCFTDVNIYEDEVRLLQYPFNSPISTHAAINFYRFFIVDTVEVGGVRAIEVNFTPNNPQDFGFSGALWVAADSTYRVLRADMGIPGRSDVNYVESMRIIQEFGQLPSGDQVLTKDDMLVQLKVTDFMAKFMVKRTTEYSHFSFEEIPEKSFKFKGMEKTLPDAMMKDEAFWGNYRSDPLSETEAKMDQLVHQLENVKGFKPVLWVAKAFIENFVETTTDPHTPSKVDFGPVNTTISQNFVDGLRLRASAQTTAALHPNIFLRGYVAYGFEDKRFKGLAEATYSFLPKAFLPREFPVHSLTLSYNSDVMSPVDKFLPTDKDNVFTSFKWTTVDHMTYYQTLRLHYDREWENNLRLRATLARHRYEPTAALFYQPLDGTGSPTRDATLWQESLVSSEATLSLEYQPGARWINTKQRRYKPNMDNPVFTLSHTIGMRGVLGGDYDFHLTEAGVYKRFWLRSWGKIDAQLKAGAQWSRVPFPLLIMPAANLSYIMEDNTFNLVDNMEFLNDRYASLMLSWDMNGKIFNRVPLLRRLKWREYLGCNVLWGTLTDKNNPFLEKNASDSRLFYFPGHFDGSGNFTFQSGVMDAKKPYVEVFAGVHNIFKILHVEYVRRLTYTEGIPESHRWGIRGMLRVTF
ncbi:MAG: carboxypeptidase-like regulatory domain-containing protein [Alloprevotella sp.]|nr:carboxypeptidase-like regulatory domain-containing protein [Alloprevotella sp.]